MINIENKLGTIYVIIPTYNRSKMLTDAIESVLNQDYPYIRIAVIDDGSKDDTSYICKAYIEKYSPQITYIYKENGGCSSSRNRGLELMVNTDKYICFLDSDDKLLPGKFSSEIRLLCNNPSADFCYSDSIIYDDERKIESLSRVAAAGIPKNFAIEHFLTNEAKCSAILYKSNALIHKRFREDLKYNEDSDFLQKIALEYRGIYCPTPGCWIRFHSGSKSKNLIEINKAVLKSSLDILTEYPEFYHQHKHEADRRIQYIKKTLLSELVISGLWEDARPYAESILEKFVVAKKIRKYHILMDHTKNTLRGVRKWIKQKKRA